MHRQQFHGRGGLHLAHYSRFRAKAAPAPAEPVTITGRLRDSEMLAVGREPFRAEGAMQVYSINPGQVSQVTGVPLTGSYLQLVEDQPGVRHVFERFANYWDPSRGHVDTIENIVRTENIAF